MRETRKTSQALKKPIRPHMCLSADSGSLIKMARTFHDYAIDTVCHFAAESHMTVHRNPRLILIQTQYRGTFNLLKSPRNRKPESNGSSHQHGMKSTAASHDGYFTETTPDSAQHPYSASKKPLRSLVRAYHTTYGFPDPSKLSNNLRPVSVSGKTDSPDDFKRHGRQVPAVYETGKKHPGLAVFGGSLRGHPGEIIRRAKTETYNVGATAKWKTSTVSISATS